MMQFIKNHSLESIKNKFILLYILNVTDFIFTILLLSTGFYMEANTLMARVLESPAASFALKLVLPAVLFMFVHYRMRKATSQQLKQSNFLINGATLLYVLINISHLVWIVMLPVFAKMT